MTVTLKKRLVIDADVARSSGRKDSRDRTARYCRDFLDAACSICYQSALVDDLREEWNKHQSPFFLDWRQRMKEIGKESDLGEGDQEIRRKIESAVHKSKASPAEKEAMLKDVHLLVAAFMTDRIVVSREKESRSLFSILAEHEPLLREIVWINPADLAGQGPTWLKSGASPDKRFRLGSHGEPGGARER